MISNWISLITCFAELFLVSGICFGFSFLRKFLHKTLFLMLSPSEYVLEDEQIFFKEKCGGDPIQGETVLCQEAKEYYNFVFTCCLVTAVSVFMLTDKFFPKLT